jgi:lipoyl-dependent peroxiredoxin subunit D
MMQAIDRLRDGMLPFARDIQLNLSSVLQGGTLDDNQRWGVAVAAAVTARNAALLDAVLQDAAAAAGDAAIDDGRAAASLMAMNNVYYRFRHLIGKDSYSAKPARLRMNRIGQPKTNKATFELICLAVSAINGCEVCVQSHENAVIQGGLSEDHVHDAVRIAATIQAAATALDAIQYSSTTPAPRQDDAA